MKRLKELRIKRGLQQKEVAADLQISKSAISQYEAGNREPDFELLKKLADYYYVSIDYLLERTDDPSPLSETEWKNIPFAMSSPDGYDDLSEEGKRQIQSLVKFLLSKEK